MARNTTLVCDCGKLSLAWAAGLFEGEGSVYVTFSGDYMTVHLQVVQSGLELPDVISRFAEIVGARNRVWGPGRPSKGSHAKLPVWGVRMNDREEISRVMESLYPFMGRVKRAQWDEVKAEISWYIRLKRTEARKHGVYANG